MILVGISMAFEEKSFGRINEFINMLDSLKRYFYLVKRMNNEIEI